VIRQALMRNLFDGGIGFRIDVPSFSFPGRILVMRTQASLVVVLSLTILSPAVVTASANRCASSKDTCVAKHAAAWLTSYAKAQKGGLEVDAVRLEKANAKLAACFAKNEDKQDAGKPETVCRTSDDGAAVEALVRELTVDMACATNPLSCPSGSCAHSPCEQGAALSASCNPCVEDICSQDVFADCCTTAWDAACTDAVSRLCQLDCGSEAVGPNKCSAGKTACVNKRLAGLLKCYAKAQKAGTPLDATCVQKVQDKFDGGANPAKGCFAKVEAKQDAAKPETVCPVEVSVATAESRVDHAVERLACGLDDDNCPCCNGRCQGALEDSTSDATVDVASQVVCGNVYDARTSIHQPCESTCGTCSFGETCIDGQCQAETRGRRCVAAYPAPACAKPGGSCSILVLPYQTSTPLRYIFMDVDGYQDEPLWVHVRPSQDITALYDDAPTGAPNDASPGSLTLFSCDATNGSFYFPKFAEYTVRTNDYDANGVLTDLLHLDAHTTRLVDSTNCKTFAAGPVIEGFRLSYDQDGLYLKFLPNPGVWGDHIAEFVMLVDDSTLRSAGQRSLPYTAFVYRINIRQRTTPTSEP